MAESSPETDQSVQINELVQYALTHAIVYGMKPANVAEGVDAKAHSVHAPFTLAPFPFPKCAFEKALSLMPLFNSLYAK